MLDDNTYKPSWYWNIKQIYNSLRIKFSSSFIKVMYKTCTPKQSWWKINNEGILEKRDGNIEPKNTRGHSIYEIWQGMHLPKIA